jgi:hypothetical protein
MGFMVNDGAEGGQGGVRLEYAEGGWSDERMRELWGSPYSRWTRNLGIAAVVVFCMGVGVGVMCALAWWVVAMAATVTCGIALVQREPKWRTALVGLVVAWLPLLGAAVGFIMVGWR